MSVTLYRATRAARVIMVFEFIAERSTSRRDVKKKWNFVEKIGARSYAILCSLCSPDSPFDSRFSLDELSDKLVDFHCRRGSSSDECSIVAYGCEDYTKREFEWSIFARDLHYSRFYPRDFYDYRGYFGKKKK